MRKRNLTQKQFSQACGLSQPLISKILSGQVKITLDHIVTFSNFFNIPIEQLFIDPDISQNTYSTGTLIQDSSHSIFNGYFGNYYTFFYSTISTEDNLLKGELNIYNDNSSVCKVQLCLYTGKTNLEGKPIVKKYNGNMIISVSMGTCYCILINEYIGEMCFILFNHMYLFHNDLECRMGVAITTSSGDNRRPTAHRILISRYDFNISDDYDDLNFVEGQLKLNESKINITSDRFSELMKNLNDDSDEKRNFLKDFLNMSQKEEMYSIEESIIRSLPYSTKLKLDCISLLRKYSTSLKYNKISSKTDEYIFKYIEKKPKSQNHK